MIKLTAFNKQPALLFVQEEQVWAQVGTWEEQVCLPLCKTQVEREYRPTKMPMGDIVKLFDLADAPVYVGDGKFYDTGWSFTLYEGNENDLSLPKTQPITQVATFTPDPATYKVLRQVAVRDKNRPALNYLYVKGEVALAVDGYIATQAPWTPTETPYQLFASPILEALLKDTFEEVQVWTAGDDGMLLRTSSWSYWYKIQATYDRIWDITGDLRAAQDKTFPFPDPKEVLDMLLKASKNKAADQIDFMLGHGTFMASSHSQEVGDRQTIIPTVTPGDCLEFVLDKTVLQGVLAALGKPTTLTLHYSSNPAERALRLNDTAFMTARYTITPGV